MGQKLGSLGLVGSFAWFAWFAGNTSGSFPLRELAGLPGSREVTNKTGWGGDLMARETR